jgi:molybdopterin-guanine dinucleotide biosynthesis protein A
VCESNSARLVLEPGAFVIIRAATEAAPKASCAAVLQEADRVLEYQDGHWDQSTEGWRFEGGEWAVPAAATAAVLAGGQSRRMGRDKRFLQVGGRTLLGHIVAQLLPVVDEVLVGANDEVGPPAVGARVVADEVPGLGPLGGIGACLAAARHDRVFVTACDIPTLPPAFVRMMLRRAREADIAIPVGEDGRHEPMLAVYSRRVLPALRSILAGGGRRVTDLLEAPGVRVLRLPLPRGDWYRNLNFPADYGSFLNA